MRVFQLSEIGRLAHQLSMSPLRHRLRQIAGAERVLGLIDPDKEYPHALIYFHVTGYRPRRADDVLLPGRALLEDLAHLVESLSESCPVPAAQISSALHAPEELAARFHVSGRTIQRWKARGLAWRWFAFPDGRRRPAVADDTLRRFVARNAALIGRASHFELLTADERAGLLARARELLAGESRSFHAVAQVLASESGRAVETIRLLLQRSNIQISEFQPASDAPREKTALPIACVYSPEFDEPDADALILGPAGDGPTEVVLREKSRGRIPSSLPPYLADLYRLPLLTPEGERRLFRQFNFLKYRAEAVRSTIRPDAPDAAAVQTVETLLARAGRIKNEIVRANLRLVVSVAKRHVRTAGGLNLFELISEGNIVLLRAVERYDYSRGFKFSTYATWAVTRCFARAVPMEAHRSIRYQTGRDDLLEHHRAAADAPPSESAADERRQALARLLDRLDEVERSIVERHFGLRSDDGAASLEEIGRSMRISKERARQIKQRALEKLRAAMQD